MQAFHGDPAIKEKYLARVRAHARADELVQGTGWENGRGCAVGCTFDRYDHSRGPVEIGVPEWLIRLEDSIFEGLPRARAMKWPAQFLAAIPVGVDLEPVRWSFLHGVQARNLERLKDAPEPYGEQCRAAVRGVIEYLKKRQVSAASSAAESASSAAESAWSAAESASSAAESAWSAAESAWSAARSAWSAARSAWSAAESAESAARSARSAWSAESAARSARSAESAWSAAESAESAARSARSAWSASSSEYSAQATELLKLLEAAK